MKKKQQQKMILLLVGLALLLVFTGDIQSFSTVEKFQFSEELGLVTMESRPCGFFCQLIKPFEIAVPSGNKFVGDPISISSGISCESQPIQAIPVTIQVAGPNSDTITFQVDVINPFVTYVVTHTFTPSLPGTYALSQGWECPLQSFQDPTVTFQVLDVECTQDSQCSGDSFERVCSGGNVVEITTEGDCNSLRQCTTNTNQNTIEVCQYGCSDSSCDSEPTSPFWRFEGNDCSQVNLVPSQVTPNDYTTLQLCRDNIVPDEEQAETFWTFENNQCTEQSLLPSLAGSNDYSVRADCEALIMDEDEDDDEQTEPFWRFNNNDCTVVFILPSDRTSTDFTTEASCRNQIVSTSPNNTLIIIIIVGLVVVVGIIVVRLSRSRGRRRK